MLATAREQSRAFSFLRSLRPFSIGDLIMPVVDERLIAKAKTQRAQASARCTNSGHPEGRAQWVKFILRRVGHRSNSAIVGSTITSAYCLASITIPDENA
jgi:hypothetical protein